jgi:fructose-1,6-bisphosphatase/inositol monophosphatase family enzyme
MRRPGTAAGASPTATATAPAASTPRPSRTSARHLWSRQPLNAQTWTPGHPNSPLQLSRLYQQARRFRWSGDCVNYALLCQGRIDVALDPRMNPWDIAALAPCVQEAGGVLSSADGNPEVVWQDHLIASANPRLHAKVLEALRG